MISRASLRTARRTPSPSISILPFKLSASRRFSHHLPSAKKARALFAVNIITRIRPEGKRFSEGRSESGDLRMEDGDRMPKAKFPEGSVRER
jgi:hypothetical protein